MFNTPAKLLQELRSIFTEATNLINVFPIDRPQKY